jgi:hypothetical protein
VCLGVSALTGTVGALAAGSGALSPVSRTGGEGWVRGRRRDLEACHRSRGRAGKGRVRGEGVRNAGRRHRIKREDTREEASRVTWKPPHTSARKSIGNNDQRLNG